MPLTQEEIDTCRDAFMSFDKSKKGTIDVWELRQVLEGAWRRGNELAQRAGGRSVPRRSLLRCHLSTAAPRSILIFTCGTV